ncbi:MAG: ankyrin repeat domain-containing protein, partial [Planctomycetota bacterium]
GTALIEAVAEDQLETVKFLLINGVDTNARGGGGHTPLYTSFITNNVKIGRILLEHGADPALECNGRRISDEFLKAIKQRSK